MTLALLLGVHGLKVLLLEKGPHIGGSLRRFCKEGVPFDTGFHFTGGFYKNGVLLDMLNVLGIRDYIQPVFLKDAEANRLVFEKEGMVFDMPTGIARLARRLNELFPAEASAIKQYFDLVKKVCSNTTAMDLRCISLSPDPTEEDFITLEDALSRMTDNQLLKGFFSSYCMCYGVRPAEVSFANHARVAFGLYESVARVKNGGDAFIRAFTEKSRDLDIEIKCNAHIVECLHIQDDRVGAFLLDTQEEVSADLCVFTIHPKEILNTLPQKRLSKAFIERVQGFEPSVGFFSVFATVDERSDGDAFEPTILSLLPSSDLNQLLDPGYTGTPALVILRNHETHNGQSHRVINAFEPSFPQALDRWKDSRVGHRPKEYREYKESRVNDITERITRVYPRYRDSLKVVDAASTLTFRDYLHSPDGSAYGIKQKIGQFNLFGKLPLSNLYVAGQSAVLPGIVGAMLSSFIVARSLIGKNIYSRFIEERLCN